MADNAHTPDVYKRQANLRAMVAELKKARDIAADADGKCQGLIGYNIMVATKDYADYVKTAAHAGADVIISGAGLPVDLPEYVTGTEMCIRDRSKPENCHGTAWPSGY